MRVNWSLSASAMAFAICLPGAVQGQEAPELDPETGQAGPPPPGTASNEIFVTAQRRAERVTDVPISITVANEAQLARQQVNTVADLSRISPSLEINSSPAQSVGGGGTIRGIGTATFSRSAVAAVGIVVDQVPQGNANISDLLDVARVEVLKGPQGTLFGLTTSAGVINITTNAPDPTRISGRVLAQLSGSGFAGSEFGQQVVQGVLNVPFSDNSAVRVTGYGNFRDGPTRNTVDGEQINVDRFGARARFLWSPTDRLDFNVIGDFTKSDYTGGGDFFTYIVAPPAVEQRLADCGVTVGAGNRDFCTSRELWQKQENYGASAQLDYELDPFSLTSITSYRGSTLERNQQEIFRAQTFPFQLVNRPTDQNIRLWTQEFRISSPSGNLFEYTAGLFYSNSRLEEAPQATFRSNPAGIEVLINPGLDVTVQDVSKAVFGQATINATDTLRLIAGLRYTDQDLSVDSISAANGARNSGELSSTNWSYRAGVQYDFGADAMAYATYVRGYKAGQVDAPAPPALPTILQPEIPTSYEIGLKATFLESWVMDLNAWYQDIEGFQAQNCTTTPSGNQSCVGQNINGVKSRGAEINFFGRLFEGLDISTGLIYAKATYPGGFNGIDGSDLSGQQITNAPRWKFVFSGEYERPVSNLVDAFIALDTVWKSETRFEQTSYTESFYREHWLVGGQIGVRGGEDDAYSVAVFVRNAFNVHEPSTILGPLGGGVAGTTFGAIYGPNAFRQVGVALGAKF